MNTTEYAAMVDAIDEFGGNDPETGVALDLSPWAYAAYADNMGHTVEHFSEWRADAESAYAGEFNSNEDFARDLADSSGMVSDTEPWPYSCIDWQRAASELMHDYFSYQNYYFRSM